MKSDLANSFGRGEGGAEEDQEAGLIVNFAAGIPKRRMGNASELVLCREGVERGVS